jgi:hypothetical protein
MRLNGLNARSKRNTPDLLLVQAVADRVAAGPGCGLKAVHTQQNCVMRCRWLLVFWFHEGLFAMNLDENDLPSFGNAPVHDQAYPLISRLQHFTTALIG